MIGCFKAWRFSVRLCQLGIVYGAKRIELIATRATLVICFKLRSTVTLSLPSVWGWKSMYSGYSCD
jgi:hypothetical protein